MDKKLLDNLAVLIQSGDENAFAEFYQLTKNGLFAFLLSVVGQRETAEDIMQDTYIKFRQSVQGYKPGTNPSAFIIQIGKNLAYNFIKRSKFESSVDFSEWEPSDGGGGVERAADTTVLDAMKRSLSAEEAQIITLHVVSGFKHREIAEMLGKPVGTVLWTYNNSIKKLQKKLKEEDNE